MPDIKIDFNAHCDNMPHTETKSTLADLAVNDPE
jgi:hypothetical protein